MGKWLRSVLAIVLVLQSTGLRADAGLPDLGDSAQAELTPQMERKVGEQIMRQIRRDPDFVSDPEVAAYIQRLGQRLVAASGETRQEFEFFVVRDPTINAFAMPGGFIGVHSGLIIAASSESELAAVMAHEVAHVTQRHLARQLQKQSQLSMLSLAGLVIGLLAARSNPQAASAAVVGAQAAPLAAYLSYSRDFEREADRVGFGYLQKSGYDVFGMPGFFDRLQQNSRLYDNNAPAYLRTHPITTERLADMQNRVENLPVRQTPDSVDFVLVRAKLRAEQGRPEDAVAFFREVLRDRRFAHEWAARYGHAVALVRAKEFRLAAEENAGARRLGPASPMLENQHAAILADLNELAGARAAYEAALSTWPDNTALRYGYAELLQRLGQHDKALAVLADIVRDQPREPRAFFLRAKSYSALGSRFDEHRALAEAYALQNALPAAIQQLEYAQASGQGDFYALSAVDARARELRRLQAEEIAERNKR
jgi:predicted Zn-dependent protease